VIFVTSANNILREHLQTPMYCQWWINRWFGFRIELERYLFGADIDPAVAAAIMSAPPNEILANVFARTSERVRQAALATTGAVLKRGRSKVEMSKFDIYQDEKAKKAGSLASLKSNWILLPASALTFLRKSGQVARARTGPQSRLELRKSRHPSRRSRA
jgi:hypothetical protein